MYEEEIEVEDLVLTAEELAERWKVDVRVLAGLRAKKEAPGYIKVGAAVRYPLAGILAVEATNIERFENE
jgi:hypothetical protein